MRGRFVHVQRLRQHPLAHRHHHLDHARHTRGGLRVTDVRLQRPQIQWPFAGTVLPVRRDDRLRLDRVTERRARTVRLHRVHVGGRQTRARQRLPDDPLLRGAVRRGQTVARAVLVHRRATHRRQHPVAVAHRVRQPLHQQHTDTLGPARPVRGGRERLAPPVRRQPPLTAELDEHLRRRHHRHTTGQRHRALAAAQRLHGQVQTHQGRRARRVHGDRGALETEGVRQPARGGAAGVAHQQVTVDALGHLLHARRVVVVHHADEHAGPAAAQRGRVDPGPLQHLPGGLQQ